MVYYQDIYPEEVRKRDLVGTFNDLLITIAEMTTNTLMNDLIINR